VNGTSLEDLASLAVDYASQLGAEYVDVRAEHHYNELATVANGKVERAVVNRRAAWEFELW